MKILICGGHLTPALAFIKGLPKNSQIVYVGRKHALENDSALSLEYQTISKEINVKFINFQTGRFNRSLTKQTFISLLKAIKSFKQANDILRTEKPNIVIGFGSYVSLPLGIVAYLRKIPLIIHEQTFKAGLTNKILSKFANLIAISWIQSQKYFPQNKTILTGNPSLEEYFTDENTQINLKSKMKKLLIIGGSQGSHFINNLVLETMTTLAENFEILHQTGDSQEFLDYSKLERLKRTLPKEISKNYNLVKFIDPKKIKNTFINADLIISRAGVNSVSALMILEKPSLLIPLTINKSDQLFNANFFVNSGLGKTLNQNILTSDIFLNTINDMILNINNFKLKTNKSILEVHKNSVSNLVKLTYGKYQKNYH